MFSMTSSAGAPDRLEKFISAVAVASVVISSAVSAALAISVSHPKMLVFISTDMVVTTSTTDYGDDDSSNQ